MFEPSVAALLSSAGDMGLVRVANFGFLLRDGELWAFDRVRLAIQFFDLVSTATSSSLLISNGSQWLLDRCNLWRFNLFADAVFTLDSISADESLRLLNLRFELLLSIDSNASSVAFLRPRRFKYDSELSMGRKIRH